MVIRALGLTPQAMYLSRLRRWAAAIRRTARWRRTTFCYRAAKRKVDPERTALGRDEPRSGDRFIAWGVSPRFENMQIPASAEGAKDN